MRRALVVAAAVLLLAGRGPLAPPESFGDLPAWLEERGTVSASIALVRLAALGVVAWLLVLVAIDVTARAFGAVRVAAIAGRALPAALVLSAAPASAAQPYDEGTATMSVLPDDADPAPAPPPVPPPAPAPVVEPPPSPPDEWTVVAGESFWSIAEEVVGEALGRTPSVAEVDGYWRTLIEANRDRLVSPSPDLVRPGQVFVLPPVSAGA